VPSLSSPLLSSPLLPPTNSLAAIQRSAPRVYGNWRGGRDTSGRGYGAATIRLTKKAETSTSSPSLHGRPRSLEATSKIQRNVVVVIVAVAPFAAAVAEALWRPTMTRLRRRRRTESRSDRTTFRSSTMSIDRRARRRRSIDAPPVDRPVRRHRHRPSSFPRRRARGVTGCHSSSQL